MIKAPEKVWPTELPTIMTAILIVAAPAGVVRMIRFTQLGMNRERPAPIMAAPVYTRTIFPPSTQSSMPAAETRQAVRIAFSFRILETAT